jgi:8-oxo-dGTP diphosphatase
MAEPLVDKNGLTEEEFLARYTPKDYPRPSLTADNCVFRRSGAGAPELLLVRRGGHPYLGRWALPGGFVSPGETALEASARELVEETGVRGLALEPVGLYSEPGRDPRGWVVSQAFVALDAEGRTARAGDDAADARWFSLDASCGSDRGRIVCTAGDAVLTCEFEVARGPVTGRPQARGVRGEGFAFDHARIVADAYLLASGALS